jgi:hypothetical protein
VPTVAAVLEVLARGDGGVTGRRVSVGVSEAFGRFLVKKEKMETMVAAGRKGEGGVRLRGEEENV